MSTRTTTTTAAIIAIGADEGLVTGCESVVVEVELWLLTLVVESVVSAVVGPGMCGI